LFRLLVPGVAKPDRVRQSLDVRGVAGQKVPTCRTRRAVGTF